jgi:aminopeptidase N
MLDKKVKYLSEYKPLNVELQNVNLKFIVECDSVTVSNIIKGKILEGNDITLNGEDLETKKIILNGKILVENVDYKIQDSLLIIYNIESDFILETEVVIYPAKNTKLMGLYLSNGTLCTQCEPEGFRRITWFFDRPDAMCVYNVYIEADKNKYPTLLSNGNLIEKSYLGDDKHYVVFEDPFKKPCYLFAIVLGNFDVVSKPFINKNNQNVDLNVFVEIGKKEQAIFALESLEKSMKFDEDQFNLVYELSVFNIVAVRDFNFGAMENKSLNIFNDAYILATPNSATDNDFFNVEAVVAHEYFHNFTGNRITCKNWFQLTLKEGLTVFRDQFFSESIYNKDTLRVDNVEFLKNKQFKEDMGPLSHPIRPESYIEMNNFYTLTVYEKGAEIVRMVYTILGEEIFKRGIDKYFELFDGQAVTCEDFIYAMECVSARDFSLFKNWYKTNGTPTVKCEVSNYNEGESDFVKIKISQFNAKNSNILMIPLKIAIFDANGNPIQMENNQNEKIILLDEKEKEFIFEKKDNKLLAIIDNAVINEVNKNKFISKENMIFSVNRGFSAPVNLDYGLSLESKKILAKKDSDFYNKYNYFKEIILENMLQDVLEDKIDNSLHMAKFIEEVILNYSVDDLSLVYFLRLPTFDDLSEKFIENLPVKRIFEVIKKYETQIAVVLKNKLIELYSYHIDNPDVFSPVNMQKRTLRTKIIYYLAKLENEKNIIEKHYFDTSNITNKIAVLNAIRDIMDVDFYKYFMDDFYNNYRDYHLLIDKWMALNSTTTRDEQSALINVKMIMETSYFNIKNPNNVRALIGGFANNNFCIHGESFEGYSFLFDMIEKLDKINSSVASGIVKTFAKFKTLKKDNKAYIKNHLEKLLENKNLSLAVFEITDKILNN